MFVCSTALLLLLSDLADNLSLCVFVFVCVLPSRSDKQYLQGRIFVCLDSSALPAIRHTRLRVTLHTPPVTVCPLALCSPGISTCVLCVLLLAAHIWGDIVHVCLRLEDVHIFVTVQGALSLILMCAPKPLPSALCQSAASCSEPPIVVPLVRQTAHNRDRRLAVRGTTEHY